MFAAVHHLQIYVQSSINQIKQNNKDQNNERYSIWQSSELCVGMSCVCRTHYATTITTRSTHYSIKPKQSHFTTNRTIIINSKYHTFIASHTICKQHNLGPSTLKQYVKKTKQ